MTHLYLHSRFANVVRALSSPMNLRASIGVVGEELYDLLADDPRVAYLDAEAVLSRQGEWDALILQDVRTTTNEITAIITAAREVLADDKSPLIFLCPNSRHISHLASRGAPTAQTTPADFATLAATPSLTHVRQIAQDCGLDLVEQLGLGFGYTLPDSPGKTPFEEDAYSISELGQRLRTSYAQACVLRRSASQRQQYTSEEFELRWGADPQAATAWLFSFVEGLDGRSVVWSDASVVYASAGLWEEALSCARRAVTYDPWNVTAIANLKEIRASLTEPPSLADLPSVWELDLHGLTELLKNACAAGDLQRAVLLAELGFVTAPSEETASLAGDVLRQAELRSAADDFLALWDQISTRREEPIHRSSPVH